MSLVLLETTADTMTVGWGQPGVPRNIEIRVNNQDVPVKVTISSGLVKKKNLKVGDEVAFRIEDDNGWSSWHTFTHDGGVAHPPPPRVHLEPAGDNPATALAMVEFDAIVNCSRYEIAMFPLDESASDWISISDTIASTVVKKKNLHPRTRYSFKYRGFLSPGTWGPWSAASVPEAAPEPNMILSRAVSQKLLRVDGSKVDASILSGKLIGLYFSAHWCPPCRNFTPKLVEFYRMLKGLGKPFEIVFVSADNDESSFQQYFSEMGWLAVPYDDPRREELPAEHGVRGIPSLKILSPKTGKVVEPDAARYPLSPATFDAWYAKI